MRLKGFVGLAAPAALAALAATSCYTEDATGPGYLGPLTTVEITDGPFPYDSVARVDIYIVSIAVRNEPDTSQGATGWITVAEPRHRFNLLELSAGETDTLGGTILPPGEYKAVRMVIDTDSSSITALTGQRMAVDWQSSAGRPALHALVENPIGVPDTGTSIVIDFDVGRSFVCGRTCTGFVFSPMLRAVNRFATGSVSGVVTGDTLAVYSAPIANVTITVYSGDPTFAPDAWAVRATGRTDATGHFRIAYLSPGRYILRADAPRASPFTPGVRANVIVSAGAEVVNQGITLPRGTSEAIVVTPLPPYAYVGDSVELNATLLDSAGVVVPGGSFLWSNLDTAVAGLSVAPSPISSQQWTRAILRPRAAGTARILVAAGTVSRTLTIPVLGQPSSGVDWVRVTPDSATVAVGDSACFSASARDSAGVVMPAQAFAWVSSDTTVAIIEMQFTTASGNGALLRARRPGSTIIRATSGGKTGSATLNVR